MNQNGFCPWSPSSKNENICPLSVKGSGGNKSIWCWCDLIPFFDALQKWAMIDSAAWHSLVSLSSKSCHATPLIKWTQIDFFVRIAVEWRIPNRTVGRTPRARERKRQKTRRERRCQREAERDEVERENEHICAHLLQVCRVQLHSSTGSWKTDGCYKSCQSLTGMHKLVMHALNMAAYFHSGGVCSVLNNYK